MPASDYNRYFLTLPYLPLVILLPLDQTPVQFPTPDFDSSSISRTFIPRTYPFPSDRPKRTSVSTLYVSWEVPNYLLQAT